MSPEDTATEYPKLSLAVPSPGVSSVTNVQVLPDPVYTKAAPMGKSPETDATTMVLPLMATALPNEPPLGPLRYVDLVPSVTPCRTRIGLVGGTIR